MRPLIIIDDKIPFIRGVLEPYAGVNYLPGKAIDAAAVAGAAALIVRTRTRCDGNLLRGSRVRCVVTATIGFDHIAAAELAELGIAWSNAPGCNAASVKNYIASALSLLPGSLQGRTLGIVGVGHVGKLVQDVGRAFGMRVLLNDPPRAEAEGPEAFTELRTLLAESDVVTLHVPLVTGGRHPTVGMAGREFFAAMKRGAWFFNSCRGEAVDGTALTAALASKQLAGALMDVWPGEPDIDRNLLARLFVATPHIAGYSVEGKANGTGAAVRYTAAQLGIPELQDFSVPVLPPPEFDDELDLRSCQDPEAALRQAVLHVYDVRRDTAALKAAPDRFEALRGGYWKRREFSACKVRCRHAGLAGALRLLGFKVELTA